MATVAALFIALPVTAAPPASKPVSGTLRLDDSAVAYIPVSLQPVRPVPLLILLHGAGGNPHQMISVFRDEAERNGVALLAPASKDITWDMLVELKRDVRKKWPRNDGANLNQFRPTLGVDLPRIRAAMDALRHRIPFDPATVALAGFSDGASYALTVGTHHPETFDTVIAYSPGFAILPRKLQRSQRIYLSHGDGDPILPFDNTRMNIVTKLSGKVALLFRPFKGGHGIPDAVQDESVRFFRANIAGVPEKQALDDEREPQAATGHIDKGTARARSSDDEDEGETDDR